MTDSSAFESKSKDTSSLAGVIARLERATEGSRELDGIIYAAVTGPMSWSIPHYTTSLDAAMTLVNEKRFPEIRKERTSSLWKAALWDIHGAGSVGRHKVREIAVVIAALKARL